MCVCVCVCVLHMYVRTHACIREVMDDVLQPDACAITMCVHARMLGAAYLCERVHICEHSYVYMSNVHTQHIQAHVTHIFGGTCFTKREDKRNKAHIFTYIRTHL